MGFAVTASHLVFALALLTAGSHAAASHWKVSEDLESARRAEAARAEEVAHTAVTIVGTPSYNSGADRVTFFVKNEGATVLKVSQFVWLVDGRYTTSLATSYPKITGASSTDFLLPGETMEVRINNVATSPTRVAAIAENGVGAYWGA